MQAYGPEWSNASSRSGHMPWMPRCVRARDARVSSGPRLSARTMGESKQAINSRARHRLRSAMEIRTTASKIVYGNRWMRVREDQIERANGTPGIYGVSEKLDYSLIIPRDDQGVFLVEQYRYPVQARYWEFPQ